MELPLDGNKIPRLIEAAIPQLRQWWLDQVAAYEAEQELKKRNGRPRGRPGLRPT